MNVKNTSTWCHKSEGLKLLLSIQGGSSHINASDKFQTKIRPQSGHVEIEMGLRTRGPTYDKSKGEQIAFNVDGAYREMRDSEDNFYKRWVGMGDLWYKL